MTCQLAGRMGDRPGLYGRDIPGSAEALSAMPSRTICSRAIE